MRTIAITSGKGGTGKTTVCANLALALAKAGRRVVVFDADLALANLDIVMGVHPECTLAEVLNGTRKVSEAITPGPFGVGLLAGGSAVGTLMRSGPKRLATFLTQLAELASSVDDLMFDTSSGLDSKVRTFATEADHTIVVTTPDPTAVTDAYALIKTLWRWEPNAEMHLVVNQVSDPSLGEAVFRSIAKTTEIFLNRSPFHLGSVRTDPKVAESVRRRQPCLEAHPDAPASADLGALAMKVAALDHPTGRLPFAERWYKHSLEVKAA
jgi:flagellar biosynthesis protein FlhG